MTEQRVEVTLGESMAAEIRRWPASPMTGYVPMVSIGFYSRLHPGFTCTMTLENWRKLQNAVALIDGSDTNVVSLHTPPDGAA